MGKRTLKIAAGSFALGFIGFGSNLVAEPRRIHSPCCFLSEEPRGKPERVATPSALSDSY
jgi:hypothetical protein